ncbi:hypothetical protein H1P_1120013 [Hyella patelloides LEGE 07179]|uniref:HTH merR-type domain-containing protein n=1 Tax=Hyella patelloides LEGE 07179 TaxID=945734 RepID=A0A563VJL3_9CYAN|nr:helix-turn-helix domain-containing protein [Hyella patelloides]VEP11656.1 hypothetical protein H1P_1120013 [Hyella patelloides LEGE 07179]
MPKLSISEAAYLLGVSTDTLRRWEKEGKITSTRTEGGHRRYDLTDILKDKEDDGLYTSEGNNIAMVQRNL